MGGIRRAAFGAHGGATQGLVGQERLMVALQK